jgi:alkylhydroperoxidase family enzyme
MARIKGITESDANDDVRQIIEEQKQRRGFISNAVQVSAVRPTIYNGVQALAQGIQDSGQIAQELRNLVCVRTAHINGCPY